MECPESRLICNTDTDVVENNKNKYLDLQILVGYTNSYWSWKNQCNLIQIGNITK